MIFVDVGAHEGQTLAEAVRYDFNRIIAFEPMPAEFVELRRFADDRVEVRNCGLWRETGRRLMYGGNAELEASLFPEKEDVDTSVKVWCEFVRASEALGDLDEPVFLKLNCEGAEVPILHDLIDSGVIWKAESILCDFDVGRIAGMEQTEREVLDCLEAIGYDRLVTSEDVVPRGRERRIEGTYRYTRADEIMCWLKSHGIAER